MHGGSQRYAALVVEELLKINVRLGSGSLCRFQFRPYVVPSEVRCLFEIHIMITIYIFFRFDVMLLIKNRT